ncbi:MAG: chloride channel protein, partial [Pseudomonadales bacterium]
LWGKLELGLVLAILIAKLCLTPVILGLGIPAGLIGPVLFIGALTGSAMGIIGGLLVEESTSHIGLYAMLGMGSMMAAVLNAPLAALAALLELTYNPNIIFPAMIAIVIGNLLVRYSVKTPSIFLASLQAQGLDYRQEPIAQALSRASVASLMSRDFKHCEDTISRAQAQQLIEQKVNWLALTHTAKPVLLSSLDLAHFYNRHVDLPDALIELQRIPAERHEVHRISERSTLYEAFNLFSKKQVSILCVHDRKGVIVGLISKSQVVDYYSQKQHM